MCRERGGIRDGEMGGNGIVILWVFYGTAAARRAGIDRGMGVEVEGLFIILFIILRNLGVNWGILFFFFLYDCNYYLLRLSGHCLLLLAARQRDLFREKLGEE